MKTVQLVYVITHIRVQFGNNCTIAAVKIVQGEAEYDFYYCVYSYSLNWMRMCVIAY